MRDEPSEEFFAYTHMPSKMASMRLTRLMTQMEQKQLNKDQQTSLSQLYEKSIQTFSKVPMSFNTVNDFIDDVNPTEDESVRYAKYVLNIKRFPAAMQMAFKPFTKHLTLYAKYEDVWYRVKVASRMGYIGITSNLTQENGYETSVGVHDITEWSNRPNLPYQSTAVEEMLAITKESVSDS